MLSQVFFFFPCHTSCFHTHVHTHVHTAAEIPTAGRDTSERRVSVYSELFPHHQLPFLSSLRFSNSSYCSMSSQCDDVIFPLSPDVPRWPIQRSYVHHLSTRHPFPPELWSVTMVFVSFLSNAIITLNSYSVKRTSAHPKRLRLPGETPHFLHVSSVNSSPPPVGGGGPKVGKVPAGSEVKAEAESVDGYFVIFRF